MSDYSEQDQADIIALGLEMLDRCGVTKVSAFRAGNYGADGGTLRALAKNNILFDSSYNYTYLGKSCLLRPPQPLWQPAMLEGIREIPISCFEQFPGSYRHAQFVACSFAELSSMIVQAWGKGWRTFVVVSHSFEFINRKIYSPNQIVARRFEELCDFCCSNADMILPVSFNEISSLDILSDGRAAVLPLKSNMFRTFCRYGEQIAKRLNSSY